MIREAFTTHDPVEMMLVCGLKQAEGLTFRLDDNSPKTLAISYTSRLSAPLSANVVRDWIETGSK
jgi:hypothetical protein